MGAEPIQTGLPHPAIRRQPVVQLDERFGSNAVPTAGSVDSDIHEAGVSKHAQMLRHLGLGQTEELGKVADEAFVNAEAVENGPPDRLRHDFECCQHSDNIPRTAYALQGIKSEQLRYAEMRMSM